MNRADVKTGHTYLASMSGRLCPVRILRRLSRGFAARNELTGRKLRIRSGRKLRRECPAYLAAAIREAERLIARPELLDQRPNGAELMVVFR